MKIVIKIVLGVVSVIIFGSVMNFMIKTSVLKDYKINPNNDILVFGDSHAECNFYDVNNGIQNFGVSSEAPNLTLLKAQHLLSDNNKHNVVITLSPHNISTWREKRLYERDSSGGILSKYWSLIDNRYLLNHYNALPFKTRALLHLKKTTGAPSIESSFLVKKSFKGGFYTGKDTTMIDLKDAKKTYVRHFGDEYFDSTNTTLNSDKLKKNYKEFISFVLSKGSDVIVVCTPIHKNYLNLISREYYEHYNKFLLELKYNFPSIRILDYTELDIPDNYFLNSDHLNFEGAKYFTELVIKEVNHQ